VEKQMISAGEKQRRIGQDLGRMVAVMLAVSIIVVVTLSVVMFRSLVNGLLEDRCVTGTSVLAYELSRSDKSEDLNQLLDELKGHMDCEFTIFEGDTRAYTTVLQNGERVVGTKLSDKVADIVLAKGKSYIGKAEIVGEQYLCSYVPTKSSNGTITGLIFAGISSQEASRQTALAVVLCAVLSAAAIVLCTALLLRYLRNRVSMPLIQVTEAARRLERGELGLSSQSEDIRVDVHSNDELGELARDFEHTFQRMRSYISEISTILGAIANGDLTNSVQQEYVGDFASIKQSLEGIEAKLASAIGQIWENAGRVSANSDQVSSSAQALAQGATEQASSVQELAATIGDISDHAKQTAHSAEEANEAIRQTSEQLTVSVDHVEHLNRAMQQISTSSEEIGKIISAIENIAFQTNILALNAAVEAARAGAAGKGFAVVADEVRNLASRSDEAAKATKELIESSVAAAQDGSSAVERVTMTLNKANEIASGVTDRMSSVVEAVERQTESIAQLNIGVDQISSVVQTNSASSEESAAASRELSSQAEMLKSLVGSFRLKRDGVHDGRPTIGAF